MQRRTFFLSKNQEKGRKKLHLSTCKIDVFALLNYISFYISNPQEIFFNHHSGIFSIILFCYFDNSFHGENMEKLKYLNLSTSTKGTTDQI